MTDNTTGSAKHDTFPFAYHITVRCYGTKLHGNEQGSVHYKDNKYDTPILPPTPLLEKYQEEILDQPPYEMEADRRLVVLNTVKEVCQYRGWGLLAAHVRLNHWHAVIRAQCNPEKILHDLKAYASRNLTKAGFDGKDRKRWARHGSTQYKWHKEDAAEAIHYVVREQGDPMEWYENDGWEDEESAP